MQKLRNSIIDRMMTEKLSAKSIQFLLHISRYQNDGGRVVGVSYKDVCQAIDISPEWFYRIIDKLEDKGFIHTEKNHISDLDIIIVDNNFVINNYKIGYVKTNHNIFFIDAFSELKAGEMLLALQFIKITGTKLRQVCKNITSKTKCTENDLSLSYKISIEMFIQKYSELLGIQARTLKKYMAPFNPLRRFFCIDIIDGQYQIRSKGYVFSCTGDSAEASKKTRSDNNQYFSHMIDAACRRANIINPSEKAKEDTKKVIGSFTKKVMKATKNGVPILQVIKDSLSYINEGIKNKKKWTHELRPKAVILAIRLYYKSQFIKI